ncbi:hypothetical protein [Aeromonas veronii]|uniref:hypothetical protein n=1 Tax=Aeromonas veronii TaxID=654 RepID=UPI003D22D583
MEQPSTHQGLVVEFVDGQLRISVGVNTLASALATGSNGMRKLSVIDAEVFAKELAKELTRAGEHGGTLVHRMLDHAAGLAADKYANWIEKSPPPNLELYRDTPGYAPPPYFK